MDRQDFLPKAVNLSIELMTTLEDTQLYKLQAECVDWLLEASSFRCEVTAPNAVAIWNVLFEIEVSMVIAADERIAEIIQARLDNAGN